MKRVRSNQQVLLHQPIFNRILVAIDREETAIKAVRTGALLAAQNGADLSIVFFTHLEVPIIPSPGVGQLLFFPQPAYDKFYGEALEVKKRWVSRLARIAHERGIDTDTRVLVSEKSLAEEAAKLAQREDADLIVVGTEDSGTLQRLIEGTFSGGLMDRAECPVLLVH